MNKETFIKELGKKLNRLPYEEKEAALQYYIEYFHEARIENNNDVEKDLGTPSKVASEILSDYAIKDTETKGGKKGISSIWFIILAVLAAPITLPLGITLIVLILSMLLVILSLVFAFGVCTVAVLGAGIFTAFAGFSVIMQDLPTSIMFIGVGLVTLGIGILISMAVFYLSKLSFRGIANISNKLLKKIRNSRR